MGLSTGEEGGSKRHFIGKYSPPVKISAWQRDQSLIKLFLEWKTSVIFLSLSLLWKNDKKVISRDEIHLFKLDFFLYSNRSVARNKNCQKIPLPVSCHREQSFLTLLNQTVCTPFQSQKPQDVNLFAVANFQANRSNVFDSLLKNLKSGTRCIWTFKGVDLKFPSSSFFISRGNNQTEMEYQNARLKNQESSDIRVRYLVTEFDFRSIHFLFGEKERERETLYNEGESFFFSPWKRIFHVENAIYFDTLKLAEVCKQCGKEVGKKRTRYEC